jgi:hypothetical protein
MLVIATLSFLPSSFVPILSSPLALCATANGSVQSREPTCFSHPFSLLPEPVLFFIFLTFMPLFFVFPYAQHRIALVDIAAVVKHKI